MVTVLLAGRPMLLDKVLTESNAVLHAFLPGTSGGQGIVDALTGSYILRQNGQSDLRNTLSFDWPKNNVLIYFIQTQLHRFPAYGADGKVPRYDDPLFKVGHGLSTFAWSLFEIYIIWSLFNQSPLSLNCFSFPLCWY